MNNNRIEYLKKVYEEQWFDKKKEDGVKEIENLEFKINDLYSIVNKLCREVYMKTSVFDDKVEPPRPAEKRKLADDIDGFLKPGKIWSIPEMANFVVEKICEEIDSHIESSTRENRLWGGASLKKHLKETLL